MHKYVGKTGRLVAEQYLYQYVHISILRTLHDGENVAELLN